jgi:hypothetical protein
VLNLACFLDERVNIPKEGVVELIVLSMVIMAGILESGMGYRAAKSRRSYILFYFQLTELQG